MLQRRAKLLLLRCLLSQFYVEINLFFLLRLKLQNLTSYKNSREVSVFVYIHQMISSTLYKKVVQDTWCILRCIYENPILREVNSAKIV